MRQIINHFTDDDLYKFTMCCAVIDNYPRAMVKYAFYDRDSTCYPMGFAELVLEQVKMLENLVISDEEIEFMKRACKYIPHWFYDFLKGFRYDSRMVNVSQDAAGHLSVEFDGPWSHTILLEVKVLAIISELYYIVTDQADKIDLELQYRQSYDKAHRLLEAGCSFSDFGSRRRASFAAQDICIKAMKECQERYISSEDGACRRRFAGTSNVYFAMKHGLIPIGTMAHELICAIAAMYGPQMANYITMQTWQATFRGALGTFLYDTYGWDIFSLNFSEDFANMFKGLRVDSGDNIDQLHKIIDKYNALGIDPRSKQVVFSNALDIDSAIAIQKTAEGICQPSFGIGTHFTNDFPGIKPLNIVIKLVAAKITESWDFYNDTCKLSEDTGKHSGKPEVVKRFKEALHIE